jgi:hypothetical protein
VCEEQAESQEGAQGAKESKSSQQAGGKVMRISVQPRRLFLLGLLSVVSAGVGGVSTAGAAEPWWQLSSALRPANLKSGLATDEVQEVAVQSASGTFTLTVTTGTGHAVSTEGSSSLTDLVTTGGAFHVGDAVTIIEGSGKGGYVPANTTITAVGSETLTISASATATNSKIFNNELLAAETTAAIPAGASPGELESALAALPGVGAGNIEVTGPVGGPYRVMFKGSFAYRPVPAMQAGGSAPVSVSELTKGRADGEIAVTAENLGDASVNAQTAPVTLADVLPPGLEAVGIAANEPAPEDSFNLAAPIPCSLASLSCSFTGFLAPYDLLEARIAVRVRPGASSTEQNTVRASGGRAPVASLNRSLRIGGQPSAYGVEDWRLRAEEEGGGFTTQAGSHPFQVTGTVMLNQGPDTNPLSVQKASVEPVALSKDIITKIPAGLIGDPVPLPRCTATQFLTEVGDFGDECPQQTAIGVASVTVHEPAHVGYVNLAVPLFNLEPSYGEPARFGFFIPITNIPVVLDTSLRDGPGEDYGVNVTSTNISQLAGLTSVRVTLWGVPNDPRHDNSRGWACFHATRGTEGESSCKPSEEQHPPAFLTMPTSCNGPLASSAEADSWKEPGVFGSVGTSEPLQSLDGCGRLPFAPAMSAEPTTDRASAPSGLDFNLDFKDEGLTSSEGIAQSQLNKTVVKLPEGLTINPSAGVGLGGCTPEDYARETVDSVAGEGCPNNSKLGTVEIETPLLTQKIHGSIYIAQPYDNPSDSLVALYVVAKNPEVGIIVKLAGKVEPNPVTGQLTTVFENNPQVAFSHFNFHFREGQQAPLISPQTCGTYTTQAALTPYSDLLTPLTVTSSFTVTKGFDGGACPSGGIPFNPGIEAGLLNNNAGAFSPFYLHLTRTDGEQYISGFSTNLPPGLTGNLTGIPFCPEADIAAARTKSGTAEEASPSCPVASQIGHTLVGTGVGAVLAEVPGKVYLAGPFHGAPFSLVAVTSAVVGPFDLGTVVLRFGLNIDPYTAQVSVSPRSSEPIPTIIQGIVTHVRDIRVYIERPGNAPFTLNPTSCNPMAIGSTLNSSLGASATVTSPFQAASCANLKFAPKFAVSTSGKTSKANGASLHVALTYPSGPQGTYADIAKVKVELPKQLPSRLTTLQKACTAAQFEVNPAGCPSPSVIGSARVVVPNIPEPLVGPVYFVSHGGEAFPSLEVVLQGYGVKVILVGSTFISKAGITSSTFKAVPDNPVSSFELTLPEGKYSALAAIGSLCTQKLTMPTDFTGQNGMQANYKTAVSVTGCAKAKALTRAQKLKVALKVCKKDRSKAKRAKCERTARRRYGPVKKKSKPKR